MSLRKNVQDIENSDWLEISDSEGVIMWSHPSLIPKLPYLFAGFIGILMGFYGIYWVYTREAVEASIITIGTPALVSLFSLVVIVYELAIYFTTFYVFTNKKVVRKVGIIARDTFLLKYVNIQHVDPNQTIFQRIFKIGDIELSSSGTKEPEVNLTDVKNYKKTNGLINTGKNYGQVPRSEAEQEYLANKN